MTEDGYYESRLCPKCLKSKLRDVQEMPTPHLTIVKCDNCYWKGKLMHAAKKEK